MGFFDVAARLSAGDGPIAALVGGSRCSIDSALQHRTFNDDENIAVGLQTSKNKHHKYYKVRPTQYVNVFVLPAA